MSPSHVEIRAGFITDQAVHVDLVTLSCTLYVCVPVQSVNAAFVPIYVTRGNVEQVASPV